MSTMAKGFRTRRPLSAIVGLLAATGFVLLPATAGADSAGGQLTWSTLSPPLSPPPLHYASAAYDADNSTVVVFGGAMANGSLSADTWVWNGSAWSRIASVPPAREMGSMAFDSSLHQLILFGGMSADGTILNDTWAWNGASWVRDHPAQSPPARYGAALSFDPSGNLVLFGGTGAPVSAASGSGGSGGGSGSTTTAGSGGSAAGSGAGGGGTTTTTTATTTTAVSPATTSGGSTVLGDTWSWNGTNWTQDTVNPSPPARAGAAMTYQGTDNEAVLFGGLSAVGTLLNDTWTWTGTAWVAQNPSTSPPARENEVLKWDQAVGGTVLFSGTGVSGDLADTWVWTGSTWVAAPVTNPPGPREGAVGAYDVAARQLLLYGGAGPDGSPLGDTSILTAQAPITVTPSPTSSAVGSTSSPPTTAIPATSGATAPAAGAHSAATAPPTTDLAGGGATVHPGDLVHLLGSGFQPNAVVTITFHSPAMTVGQTRADANGDFSATVAVPQGAAAGTHHFDAAGMSSSGGVTTLATTVRVVPLGSKSNSDNMRTYILVGLAAAVPLVTWASLSVVGRYRRRLAGAR